MPGWKTALKKSFPHTLPVLTGYLVLGLAYGVLLRLRGFGVGWALFLSGGLFAGSLQFVALGLMTTVFDPVGAFLLAFMVNARHLFYGVSMLKPFEDAGRCKPFLIFALSDETFSILCSTPPPEGLAPKQFYFWVSLLDYLYWVGGSVLGSLAGGFIPFDTRGMDFALTALFVVSFLNHLEKAAVKLPMVIGLLSAVTCLLLFGAERFMLPALGLILALFILLRRPLIKMGGDEIQ